MKPKNQALPVQNSGKRHKLNFEVATDSLSEELDNFKNLSKAGSTEEGAKKFIASKMGESMYKLNQLKDQVYEFYKQNYGSEAEIPEDQAQQIENAFANGTHETDPLVGIAVAGIANRRGLAF